MNKVMPGTNNNRKKPIRRTARGRGKLEVNPRMADVIDNPDLLKEWDDEEIARGQKRDKNGRFTGNPPAVLPRAILEEQNRRSVRKANDKLARSVEDGVKALAEIIAHSDDDKARVKAIEIMMNRVMGKPEGTVNINHGLQDQPWMKALQAALLVGEPSAELSSGVDEDGDDILDLDSEEL